MKHKLDMTEMLDGLSQEDIEDIRKMFEKCLDCKDEMERLVFFAEGALSALSSLEGAETAAAENRMAALKKQIQHAMLTSNCSPVEAIGTLIIMVMHGAEQFSDDIKDNYQTIQQLGKIN